MVRGPDQRPRYTLCVSSQAGALNRSIVHDVRNGEKWGESVCLSRPRFSPSILTHPTALQAAPWAATSATRAGLACWGASRPVGHRGGTAINPFAHQNIHDPVFFFVQGKSSEYSQTPSRSRPPPFFFGAGQIVEQLLLARKHLRAIGDSTPILRIVFMGMGEPFDSYDAVSQALAVLTEQSGKMLLGPRKVTVSVRLCMHERATNPFHCPSVCKGNPSPVETLHLRISNQPPPSPSHQTPRRRSASYPRSSALCNRRRPRRCSPCRCTPPRTRCVRA